MSYNKELREGVFIGKRESKSQQIALFEIGESDSPQDGEMRIRSIFSIDLTA